MEQKVTANRKSKAIIVFLAAAFIRIMDPVQAMPSIGILELLSAITVVIAFFCFWRWNLQLTRYNKKEYAGFLLYAVVSTLSYIYSRKLSLNMAGVSMMIYMALSVIINALFAPYGYEIIKQLITKQNNRKLKNKFFSNQLQKNGFWFYFIVLFVAYFIHLVLNYPGTMMYDSQIQIQQIYKIPNLATSHVNLIDPDQYITSHHPVLHTLLIKACLTAGDAIGSLDFGIFLYSLIQITCVAAGIAYMLKKIRPVFGDVGMMLWLALFSLHPIILMYVILMTKDTIFAVLLLVFAIKLYEYIKDPNVIKNWRWILPFSATLILTSLFRNNFLYAAVIAFLIITIVRKDIRLAGICAGCLSVCIVFTGIIVPAMGITGGSVREAISVAFQQTANCAHYHELTDEEKEIISKVLDVDTLEEYIHPEVSNTVKNTFNKNASREDLLNYFKLWVKMFFKYPLSYIDAYCNQFYGYFSTRMYYSAYYKQVENFAAREKLITRGVKLANWLPVSEYKDGLDIWVLLASMTPGIYLFNNSGIYIWIIFAAIIYLLRRKERKTVLFYLPFLLYFATLLLSPANASVEHRYLMPFMMAMPIFLLPAREAAQSICEQKEDV